MLIVYVTVRFKLSKLTFVNVMSRQTASYSCLVCVRVLVESAFTLNVWLRSHVWFLIITTKRAEENIKTNS